MTKKKDKAFEKMQREFFEAGPPKDGRIAAWPTQGRRIAAWPTTQDALWFAYQYAKKAADG